MKFPTYQKRIRALVHAYYQISHPRPLRLDAVADWGIRFGLYPIPGRDCTPAAAEAWEHRLRRAIYEGQINSLRKAMEV